MIVLVNFTLTLLKIIWNHKFHVNSLKKMVIMKLLSKTQSRGFFYKLWRFTLEVKIKENAITGKREKSTSRKLLKSEIYLKCHEENLWLAVAFKNEKLMTKRFIQLRFPSVTNMEKQISVEIRDWIKFLLRHQVIVFYFPLLPALLECKVYRSFSFFFLLKFNISKIMFIITTSIVIISEITRYEILIFGAVDVKINWTMKEKLCSECCCCWVKAENYQAFNLRLFEFAKSF